MTTTKILSEPYALPDAYGSLAMPIYQTAAFEFANAQQMEEAFCGRTADHAYSRITNPTVDYFERRIKTLTGAHSVAALNSGMAAISSTLVTLAWSGANIVASSHLFGNTWVLIGSTLRRLGVEARFVDVQDLEAVSKAIDENTCALFLEVVSNPQLEVADLAALSAICRKKRVPLVADSTAVPPHIFHAKDFGVDIEVISSTKYISGGATSLGGLIVDYGTATFDHSKSLGDIEDETPFTTRLRKETLRNLGAYMTPQVAYAQTLGLETLEVRYAQSSQSALTIAENAERAIATHDASDPLSRLHGVGYATLRSAASHDIATRQFGATAGSMLTIDLRDREAAFAFVDRLKLIRRATNLFDNKSLAIHPASTIFGGFTESQREAMNISQKTVRLSIGLERTEDLLADIRQAII